jgi:hypothetical protein
MPDPRALAHASLAAKRGKIGGRLGAFRPYSSLGVRKQSSQKAVAAPLDSARDPLYVATVCSNTDDHPTIGRG